MEIKELTREEMGGLIAGIHALGKDRLRDLVLQIWQMSEGYEQVEIDNRRLVRELDVLINGENAAQQASLCDIVAQVRSEGLKAVPAPGWTGQADADAALVMLDRIDTTDSDDDCLIEEVKSIIRRLVAAKAPAAPAMKAVVWRHDDGPFAVAAITRSKSIADGWIANGWKVTPLYELVEPGGNDGR